jgi:histidine triad (HIT) family protein
MTAYDSNNVFAKILRKELPAHVVYEDDETLTIMDIMPRAPGHCLVIPKAPARNMMDVSEESLAAVSKSLRKVSRAVMQAFSADGITIHQFNEDAGGQVVFHLHFHIIPRHLGEPLAQSVQMADQDELRANAAKIRAVLGQFEINQTTAHGADRFAAVTVIQAKNTLGLTVIMRKPHAYIRQSELDGRIKQSSKP